VSLPVSEGDRIDLNRDGYGCFGNSGPNGTFCFINFLEIARMTDRKQYPIVPWENRSSIPIWRGKPWLGRGTDTTDVSKMYDNALARSPRLRAIEWSFKHPDLLDCRIAHMEWLSDHPYWQHNATNGMHSLLPAHSIPERDYYSKYQVALVLGGIGAAFRTSIHLSTETAVVLQDYYYKEWFTPMMKPFVDYIPLAEDLSDLAEKMQWIAEHPKEVREIARNGRIFYDRYLSFDKNEEHIFELAFRLALLTSERQAGVNRT